MVVVATKIDTVLDKLEGRVQLQQADLVMADQWRQSTLVLGIDV